MRVTGRWKCTLDIAAGAQSMMPVAEVVHIAVECASSAQGLGHTVVKVMSSHSLLPWMAEPHVLARHSHAYMAPEPDVAR